MNSSATKIIAVVVILVIVVAACAVVLTSDSSDDSSFSDVACLPVYGNADEDVDIDEDDLEIIQNIIDGVDGYTLSAYPFADANYDGQVTSADVNIVNKIINNQSTTVYHYMYTNDSGNDVTTTVVSTSWPNTKVMTSYCSILFLSTALGLSENVVASTDIGESSYSPGTYYYDQTLFADIADHAIAINSSSAESIIAAMNSTGATLLVCSGYGDYDITDSMIDTLEAAGIDVVRLCESNPCIEPTVASVLLYGFLMGVEDTAQELAEFYNDVWYETLDIAESISDSDKIKATYTVAGPDNQYTYKVKLAGGDYAYADVSESYLNSYGSFTFGDWIYNVEIDCMLVGLWSNSNTGSWYSGLNADYIINTSIGSNYQTLDVYKNGNVYIFNGDVPTAMSILLMGYAMYPEYYGDLYTSAMTTMLSFLGYDYATSGIEWVYSVSDLQAML